MTPEQLQDLRDVVAIVAADIAHLCTIDSGCGISLIIKEYESSYYRNQSFNHAYEDSLYYLYGYCSVECVHGRCTNPHCDLYAERQEFGPEDYDYDEPSDTEPEEFDPFEDGRPPFGPSDDCYDCFGCGDCTWDRDEFERYESDYD